MVPAASNPRLLVLLRSKLNCPTYMPDQRPVFPDALDARESSARLLL
jgi:hypothetical protein